MAQTCQSNKNSSTSKRQQVPVLNAPDPRDVSPLDQPVITASGVSYGFLNVVCGQGPIKGGQCLLLSALACRLSFSRGMEIVNNTCQLKQFRLPPHLSRLPPGKTDLDLPLGVTYMPGESTVCWGSQTGESQPSPATQSTTLTGTPNFLAQHTLQGQWPSNCQPTLTPVSFKV